MPNICDVLENYAGDGVLDLCRLATDDFAPGLTAQIGEFYSQAAAVCLENQEHSTGAALHLDGIADSPFTLVWPSLPSNADVAWADLEETAEYGAYGVAAILVPELSGHTIKRRSCKGTGFDFWLGPQGPSSPLFQDLGRLEVSGILNGDTSRLRSRVNQKIAQSSRSNTHLEGYVVVVEFGTPRSSVTIRDANGEN